MKAWQRGCVILALGAAVTGCLPTQQQLRMERDMEEMKRRLAEVERGGASLRQGEAQERIEALSRKQADLQANLDTLRVEMQAMTGRIEDTGRQKSQSRDELTLVRDDMALKIKALEDRLARLEQMRTQAPSAPQTPQALYESGVEQIQKGDFVRGRETLQSFLSQHPSGTLTVNAMYWIGEAYYGEKKYENAILQFQDVIQKFGDHPKAASALFKQGITFNTLGDQQNAKVILNRLIETFPMSPEAKKAREQLAAWR